MLFFPDCALGLSMKDSDSFDNSPLLTHFSENYFSFWIREEVGSKLTLLKLLFLICSFAFSWSVFLSTNISQLPLSGILRINSLSVLFILSFHLFSVCFLALLILLLYFFRILLLNISCSFLERDVSNLWIWHFGSTFLLWLMVLFHR